MTSKKKKLMLLQPKKQKDKKPMDIIPNFVINKSPVHLSDSELKLLNKGLKFAIPNEKILLKDIIVDVEIGNGFG